MRFQEYIVCLVDPDEAVHDALAALLRASGARVTCFRSAEEFLDSRTLADVEIGCLLVEANLPGMGSIGLLKHVRIQSVDVPIVVLASTSNRDIAEQALKAGALEVVEKPLISDRLLERLLLDSRICRNTAKGLEH
jgi:two-component system response regulator FixJ